MNDTVTAEKLGNCLEIIEKGIGMIKLTSPKDSFSRKMAEDFLTMINAYCSDGKYYRDRGDLVTAFASFNYARGWIDCGTKMGIWNTDGLETW